MEFGLTVTGRLQTSGLLGLRRTKEMNDTLVKKVEVGLSFTKTNTIRETLQNNNRRTLEESLSLNIRS